MDEQLLHLVEIGWRSIPNHPEANLKQFHTSTLLALGTNQAEAMLDALTQFRNAHKGIKTEVEHVKPLQVLPRNFVSDNVVEFLRPKKGQA